MRSVVLLVTAAFVLGNADLAEAQKRKAKSKRAAVQQTEPASATGGLQRCEGGLFFLQDDVGPLCRRRDGKVCQIRSGGGDRAILTDCR